MISSSVLVIVVNITLGYAMISLPNPVLPSQKRDRSATLNCLGLGNVKCLDPRRTRGFKVMWRWKVEVERDIGHVD